MNTALWGVLLALATAAPWRLVTRIAEDGLYLPALSWKSLMVLSPNLTT